MAFNVDQFRTNLVGDGARPNLFEVQFTNWPAFITAPTDPQKMSFLCNAAVLPGSDIGVTPLQYFGREVKLAGNRVYQDWTVQVINDEDFFIRNIMENWTYGINGPIGNLRNVGALTVDGGYGAQATVVQYGKTGDVLQTYTFYGMWPTSISTIDLAWGTNDSIEEFSVTFAYQYWTTQDPTSGT
jgi:T4-like virus tail tube protein gp19